MLLPAAAEFGIGLLVAHTCEWAVGETDVDPCVKLVIFFPNTTGIPPFFIGFKRNCRPWTRWLKSNTTEYKDGLTKENEMDWPSDD